MVPRSRTVPLLIAAALVVTLRHPASASAAPDAGVAAPGDRFESELRAFEVADGMLPKGHPRIVFIGSSSIRLWSGLAFDFRTHNVVNRGFGGSHIADAVRNAERILAPHKPPLVVMYAGSNDIDAGKTPATVAADFKAFAAKVWARSPATAVAFISIAPSPARWAEVDRVRATNRLIADYCATDKRLTFIDVFPRMLGDDGRPRPELYQQDGLHMTRQGYLLWIPLVRGVLDAVDPPTGVTR